MQKRRIADFDATAQKAAYLRAEKGLSQKGIADSLGISQSAVSRLLERAVVLGCLRRTERFVRTRDIDDARMSELEWMLEGSDLTKVLREIPSKPGFQIKTVRVFDSGGTDVSPEGVDRRQKQFAAAVAPHLAEKLSEASVVGVTWGSTISACLDALSRSGYLWPERADQRVIPVSAEPMRFAHNEFTSSTLARRLHTIMHAESTDVPQLALTGVPAFIPPDLARVIPNFSGLPSKMSEEFSRVLRAFFEESSSAYKEIFSGRDCLIDHVDALVTSVGTAEKPMGFCNEDLLKMSGLSQASLQRLVLGDLGGVLLPARTLSARDVESVDRLNAMWTGIRRAHLERIARRAIERDTPGIMLITLGASRSAVVLEAIRNGLCSELLIDRDLAAALRAEVAT